MHRMALSQITWQDIQQLPDDGKRREAIGGELYVTPSPSFRHQRISQRLEQLLIHLLEEPGHGTVVHAPIGVEFPATEEGVQPDIVFISNARRGIICREGIRGAPDLVIEILSPTTARRDRGIKLQLYHRQGVAQYWIVDPDAGCVEVWNFDHEPPVERFTETLLLRLDDEPVGEIDLAEVFRED